MEYDAFEAFFQVVWYNGYQGEIGDWIEALERGENDCPLEILPDDRDGAYAFGQLQVLWMFLVEWFGDYGTSPRYGWIEKCNLDDCVEFLKKVVAQCDEFEEMRG